MRQVNYVSSSESLMCWFNKAICFVGFTFYWLCWSWIWSVCHTCVPQSVWSWPWPTAPASSTSQWQRSGEALTGQFTRPEIQRAGSLWLWRVCVCRRTKMASQSPLSERWLCWNGWSSSTTQMLSGKPSTPVFELPTISCEQPLREVPVACCCEQANGCMCHSEVGPGD